MKKILMIAAEYPPCLSAGVQRTYHFSENLLDYGWMPHILTANERIYRAIDNGVVVSESIVQRLKRVFALDVTVHLAVKGKYLGWLENPDRFASWYFMGWRTGRKMISQGDIDVIWSTFPVATAHWIGLKLKKETGLPWIADYRDPVNVHVDKSAKITRWARFLDKATVENADIVVFATQKMKELYIGAYPQLNPRKFRVIENGYDQNLFDNLERIEASRPYFQLLYSGGLYPQGRDPIPLFVAISKLRDLGTIQEDNFKLVFRGAGKGFEYAQKLEELNISSLVEFLEPVPFAESVQEMKNADALLVLQGEIFNNQVPGKVYEYIATKNPILGVVGELGATQQILSEVPNAYLARETDSDAIARELSLLLESDNTSLPTTAGYSRRGRSKMLAELLMEITY